MSSGLKMGKMLGDMVGVLPSSIFIRQPSPFDEPLSHWFVAFANTATLKDRLRQPLENTLIINWGQSG